MVKNMYSVQDGEEHYSIHSSEEHACTVYMMVRNMYIIHDVEEHVQYTLC